MNTERFPKRVSLRDILRNDTRIRRYEAGEIIVRAGDYGTSAFMMSQRRSASGVDAGIARIDVRPAHAETQKFAEDSSRNFGPIPKNLKRAMFRSLNKTHASKRASDRDEVHVFLQDVPRILNEHRTATIEHGDFFGEIAALSRMPRTATVFAQSAGTELLEIRWQGLRDLMKYDDSLRQHIDRIYRERALAIALARNSDFPTLSTDEQLEAGHGRNRVWHLWRLRLVRRLQAPGASRSRRQTRRSRPSRKKAIIRTA